jgi:hypothetical protein
MMTRVLPALSLALLCAGCWEFVDPEFPEVGAPAVMQVSAFVTEDGRANITGVLLPGVREGGFQRLVPDDTLRILGLKLAPENVERTGRRTYRFDGEIGRRPLEGALTIDAPVVNGVTGPPPHISWFGIRKLDPDTIRWRRGTELVLHVDTTLAPSLPPPQIQYWFLEMRAGARVFGVSANGLPRTQLHIPGDWVPASSDSTVSATLTFFQSGVQKSPSNDYIGSIDVNVQVRWIIKVE